MRLCDMLHYVHHGLAFVISAILAYDLEAVAVPPEVAVHVACLGNAVWYVLWYVC